MTTFDDRERQEETRFKHQQELAFKARNRGNKMFGLWVAQQLGLSGEEAESYARDVVIADFDLPGDEDIFTKVRADLEAKSIEMSDHVLQKRLQELRQAAAEQIRTEYPPPGGTSHGRFGRARNTQAPGRGGRGAASTDAESRAAGAAGRTRDRRPPRAGAHALRRLGKGRSVHRLLRSPAPTS